MLYAILAAIISFLYLFYGKHLWFTEDDRGSGLLGGMILFVWLPGIAALVASLIMVKVLA